MMELFANRFPEMADNETRNITVLTKNDTYPVPPDTYIFFEHYCNDKQCDCRRVMISVFADKKKEMVASINMAFDADDDDAGPFLDPLNPQSKDAPALMDIFLSWVNTDPAYLKRLNKHYVLFREDVEKRPYRKKPFPVSGKPLRKVTDPKPFQKRRKTDIIPSDNELRKAERIVKAYLKIENKVHQQDQFFKRLKDTLFKDPDILFAILHLMMNTYAPDGIKSDFSKAYMTTSFLLKEMLTELRYSVERGRPWAIDVADRLQMVFAETAFEVTVDIRIQMTLLDALYHSGLKIHPELLKKSSDVSEYYSKFQLRGNGVEVDSIFNEMVSQSSGNPFVLYDQIMSQMTAMAVQHQPAFIKLMLSSQNRLVKETGVLMVLHPEPDVRREVPLIFEKLDNYSSFMPEDLRRLIGMRSWMPVDEKSGIDDIILKMRRARVECAPMLPKGASVEAYASAVDGSGSQGMWLLELISGKRFSTGGFNSVAMLFRQLSGVHEIWGDRGLKKQEYKDIINRITQNSQCMEVNHEYINRMCAHFIQKGHEQGCPPPMLLVYAAETMGNYWRPEAINYQKVLKSMEASVDPKFLHPDYVDKMLKKSDSWVNTQHFASSWFEDNRDVDLLLIKQCPHFPNLKNQGDILTGLFLIITNILEEKRSIWADRFLLMAIRAFSCRGSHKNFGKDFFLLARELYNDVPLDKISLMISIAHLTLNSAIRRAKNGGGAGN